MSDTKIRLFGVAPDSIVDGPGLRYAVFTQGCPHACEGCHNPESWPFKGGTETTVDAVMREIEANKLLRGVTLSGGEPFEQAEACAEIAERSRALGLNVWVYTGYLYEELLARAEQEPAVGALLEATDVLVDGPFILEKRSLDLKYCGSSNQRLLDLAATRALPEERRRAGEIVRFKTGFEIPKVPRGW